jgi:hypothetical protein
MAQVTIHPVSVGPVGLHRHDAKAVLLDEFAGDRRPRLVEFGRAMRCLPQQHHSCLGERVEEWPEFQRMHRVGQFNAG